jgi:hypothetical protein
LKYWYSRSDKMPGQKRPTNCATRQWVMISRIFSGAIFYSILLATFFRSFDSARVLIKLMHHSESKLVRKMVMSRRASDS